MREKIDIENFPLKYPQVYKDLTQLFEKEEIAEIISEDFKGIYCTLGDFVKEWATDRELVPKTFPSYLYIDWERSARDLFIDNFLYFIYPRYQLSQGLPSNDNGVYENVIYLEYSPSSNKIMFVGRCVHGFVRRGEISRQLLIAKGMKSSVNISQYTNLESIYKFIWLALYEFSFFSSLQYQVEKFFVFNCLK